MEMKDAMKRVISMHHKAFNNYRIRGTLAGNPETPEEAAKVELMKRQMESWQRLTLRATSTISIQMRRQTLMKP